MIERLYKILDFHYPELFDDSGMTLDNFQDILKTDPYQIIEMLLEIIEN